MSSRKNSGNVEQYHGFSSTTPRYTITEQTWQQKSSFFGRESGGSGENGPKVSASFETVNGSANNH
jgi:hypothetical protein